MKKLLVISGIVFTTVLFSGCGGFGGFSDEPELTYEEGVLTEQVTTDSRKGSHVLTNEDASLALRSASLNLSGSDYLGNKVQVVGVLNEDEGVFEVTGISVLEILVASDDEAEFVVYKNTDLGFEIKYYEDWPMKEWQNGDIEFRKAESETNVKVSQFRFDYTPNVNEDGSIDTPLSAFGEERFKGEDLGPMSKVGVDGQEAVKYDNDDILAYYLYRNGLIYEISFFDGENLNENTMVFNEMLNNFRFVGFTVESDSADIDAEIMSEDSFSPIDLPAIDSEFSSFESIPYHFAATYPADWYYSGNDGGGDILRHYGFRNESDEDAPELIALDVVGEIPAGSAVTVGRLKGVKVTSGDKVSVYVEIEGQKYSVSGGKEYEGIMLVMASSIKNNDVSE